MHCSFSHWLLSFKKETDTGFSIIHGLWLILSFTNAIGMNQCKWRNNISRIMYSPHLFPDVIQHNGCLFFIHHNRSVISVSWGGRKEIVCYTLTERSKASLFSTVVFVVNVLSLLFILILAHFFFFSSVHILAESWSQQRDQPFIFSLHVMLLDVFLTAVLLSAGLVPLCRWK